MEEDRGGWEELFRSGSPEEDDEMEVDDHDDAEEVDGQDDAETISSAEEEVDLPAPRGAPAEAD